MQPMQSKITLALFLSFVASISSANVEKIIGSLALKDNPNLAGFLPTTDLPEILISRQQYVVSYNKERRVPNFAVWELKATNTGSSGRAQFSMDIELETYLQSSNSVNGTNGGQHAVDPTEYTGSCLDRGHVVPSADRSDTVENNTMTFVMSNVLPQTPFLNRIMWEHLEQYSRDLVKNQNKKLVIIAGPIFDQYLGGIGPHKDIQVPSKEFKIVVILDADASFSSITKDTPMIPVIMPNITSDGNFPKVGQGCQTFSTGLEDKNDWIKYKSSVEEIERLSGLKIFSSL